MRRLPTSVLAGLVASAVLGGVIGTYSVNHTPWTARAVVQAAPPRTSSGPNVMTAAQVPLPKPGESPYLCRGYEKFDVANPAAQVLRDRVTIQGYPLVTVGNGAGVIAWERNPLHQPVWSMWLHSHRWLGALIAHSATNATYRKRVATVMQSWIAAYPYPWTGTPAAAESTMHRLNVMSCFRDALTPGNTQLPATYAWLDRSIQDHLKSLAARWTGSNHGTDQSIALLGVACNLRLPTYITLARARLRTGLSGAIDAEGATSEQSTGYANMNYFLWYRAAATLKRCGQDPQLIAEIEQRRERMLDFLAHAHTPLGHMVQIGDTDARPYAPIKGTPQEYAATKGESGVAPPERVKIYQAGYVFGRAGWGTSAEDFSEQSMYALRFGPPTAWHGHHDHTALAWFAQGRPLLIDPGYGASPRDSLRPYITSPAAHNQLTMPGMSAAAPATTLVASHITDDQDSYVLRDSPAPGVTRTRHVLVRHHPPVVVVSDVATSTQPIPFTQNWHHAIGSTAQASPLSSTAISSNGAHTHVRVLQSSAPCVVATSTAPAWQDHFTQERHAVTTVTATGTSVRMVTAISPQALTVDTQQVGEGTQYTLGSNGRVFNVRVDANGALVR